MFITQKKSIYMVVLLSLLHVACAPDKKENTTEDPAIGVMSSQLQSVGDEYLPASVNENAQLSVNKVSGKLGTLSNNNDDVCAGVDFVECQPRLVREYLKMGRESVYSTQKLVSSIARNLSGISDGTSGEYRDDSQGVRITYNKRSSVDFDVITFASDVPAARISAKNGVYNIQFDSALVEKDKPNNFGGKIDIQVSFSDRTNWDTQVTVTGVGCNPLKPEDPQNARLHVTRRGDVWKVQSMFYNGISAYYQGARSCSVPASDATGLVIYTDMVADSTAAKAGIYMMKRNEQSTAQLQNFGINSYCQNYPDLCQGLANEINQPVSSVAAHLSALQNPYCVQRGTSQVFWNNNCSTVSPAVASESLSGGSAFLSPYDFYRLQITIPSQL